MSLKKLAVIKARIPADEHESLHRIYANAINERTEITSPFRSYGGRAFSVTVDASEHRSRNRSTAQISVSPPRVHSYW